MLEDARESPDHFLGYGHHRRGRRRVGGVVIDRMTSPFISLLVFFPVMFLAVWLAWRFAVKFTAPKATPSA
jgi:hypothetical protein